MKVMKAILSMITLLLSFSIPGVSQTAPTRGIVTTGEGIIERCPANPDPLYDRQRVLERLAEVLNASAPGFREYEDGGFQVNDERPQQFFVFDLADPSNKSTPSSGCINFLNNHIYHFAARYLPFSLSHVAILKDGKLKLFKSINCKESKDSIDDVIRYVKRRPNLKDKDELIQRVKDYRKYGEYFTVDDLVIRCKRVEMGIP